VELRRVGRVLSAGVMSFDRCLVAVRGPLVPGVEHFLIGRSGQCETNVYPRMYWTINEEWAICPQESRGEPWS
jgi:hypothetical protein